MFGFVVKHLGFFKYIPGLALVFDAWLACWSAISHPQLLDWIDEIEAEVLRWPNTTATTHKYGGLQLNYGKTELGHIHSNGLLDMLLSRKTKRELMLRYDRVHDHHSFKKTGWISFYMTWPEDKILVIEFLRLAHQQKANRT
ncbi:hypothetical protein FFF34_015995 [Inquilinus sp. KBS0705]|nr:hypothetical protein FFF34_015995 [Inquilinus sp. KBS0705]